MSTPPFTASPARRRAAVLSWSALLLALAAAPARAHTVDDATPFHLVPEDYFTVTVGGGVFATPADVAVEAAPVGGGAATALVVVGVDASTTIGVRLPAGIALGEYEVTVAVTGTPQTGAGPHIWVRERTLRLIKKTVPKPFDYVNPGADFKEADLVDVDGDGALDVFAANSLSGSDVDMLFMNQTNVAAPACATPFCEQIATRMDRQAGLDFNRTYDADFVDLDADGDLDLVRTDNSPSSPLRIWENVGAGQFEERTIDAGPVVGFVDSLADIDATVQTTAEMDFGDVNGDGRRDILLCPWFGPTVGLLLNEIPATGKLRLLDLDCGGASPSALCDTGPTANRGCAFGDFNNDGALDVIAPIYGGGQPLVFLHTGNVNTGHPSDDPQFSAHSDWVKDAVGGNLSMHGGDLKVADLDGDGDDDVALGSPGQGGVEHAYILWNDGGTALRAFDPEPSPFVGDAYDVAFSDLDADGDLDVVFANEFSSTDDNRVLINHGGVDGDLLFREYSSPDGIWYEEQLFGDPLPAADSTFDLSVSMGDYDLDGDRDLVGAGFSNKLDMWENGLFREDGERRDWVFALDRTRSMISGGHDFFAPAKNALIAYLGERYDTDIDGGDKVGLVSYDYTGSDPMNTCAADTELGVDVKAQRDFELGAETAPDLITHVEGLAIGGCSGFCTSIGAALRAALGMAADGATPGREQVVVVITDGRNNQCPPVEDVVPDIPSGMRVYAIALGDQTEDGALADLATNRGKFYVAGRSDDYASVQEALRDINADLEAHSTGRQVLEPLPQVVLARWAEKARRPEAFRLEPGRVIAGSTVRRFHRVAVDPADAEVRFTLSWREPNDATGMVVVDPLGRTYPLAGSPLVREQRGARHHVLEVLDPLSGVWVIGERIAGDPGPTKFTASVAGDLEWSVDPRFDLFHPDEDLVLRVALGAGAGAVPVSQVTASFLSPSDQVTEVQGRQAGEGVFEVALPAPVEPGTWRASIAAFGTPNRPFGRRWHQAVHVAARDPAGLDRRRVEIALDDDTLRAASGDTATVTAKLWNQDGSPRAGERVSFVADLGALAGAVTDHGDGSYSQTLTAGAVAGAGEVDVRAGLYRFADGAGFRILPGAAAAGESALYVTIGNRMLCANAPETYTVVAAPRDAEGNAIAGAAVAIEVAGGPAVEWVGPVGAGPGGVTYFREFRAPSEPGTLTFGAQVDGVDLGLTASIEIFGPDSPEGKELGCDAYPKPGLSCWVWLLLLLLVLVIALVVWRVVRS